MGTEGVKGGGARGKLAAVVAGRRVCGSVGLLSVLFFDKASLIRVCTLDARTCRTRNSQLLHVAITSIIQCRCTIIHAYKLCIYMIIHLYSIHVYIYMHNIYNIVIILLIHMKCIYKCMYIYILMYMYNVHICTYSGFSEKYAFPLNGYVCFVDIISQSIHTYITIQT